MGTAGAMNVWQLLLVGLVMLLGLLGAALPGVPGPLVVWAAVFWWAATEQTDRAWWLLVYATALLLAGQAVRPLLPRRPHRATDVRRRALLFAVGTGTAGFFLLPVLGAGPGFVAGLLCWERARLGSRGAAATSVRAVLRAVGWRVLSELWAGLLVLGGWLVVLVCR